MVEIDDRKITLGIVSRFIDMIKKDIRVDMAYLYGSYSKGRQRKDSDIDVAVVSPDFIGDIIEDKIRLMKYRRTIDLRIEPRPFLPDEFNMGNPFAREIIETGIPIK